MTECERIIQQGILPRSFFESEIICDFYVDERRKKVWAIELDLLRIFKELCEKYNLRYYLIFGSLLGAVRHNGFIPWDDDLDVAMPREDYEKLLLHADELCPPYFLQIPGRDHKYYYSHAKLRNSNTTAIAYPFIYSGFNLGIFLDIVPLDKFDIANDGMRRFEEIKKMIILNSTYMRLDHPALSERDKKRVEEYDGSDPNETFAKIQKMCIEDRDKNTSYVSLLAAPLYGFKRNVFCSRHFEEAIEVDFNGLTVKIPAGYDGILKVIYGNYMELPPINERGGWHDNITFNPDIPYIKALKSYSIITL